MTQQARGRGFTLVEVVVALTIVSLIMLGLVSAMRTMGQAASAVQAVSDRSSDMQLIHAFLGRMLAGTQDLGEAPADGALDTPPDEAADEASQSSQSYFEGRRERLRWVGVFPARHGLPGMHYFELARQSREGAAILNLRYLPYGGATAPPDWGRAAEHVLVGGVEAFSLAYQGEDANGPWQEEWRRTDAQPGLPARVRIRLKVEGRYWPELVYALAPL
ncbi:MAG: prepilin-type N-terminal cleavage/methylation domain-containing protein [Rhodocyclaceae bacterium]